MTIEYDYARVVDNENPESEETIGLVVGAGSAAAFDLTVGTELWYIWGCMAVEHAIAARRARDDLLRARSDGRQLELEPELRASMIAITGAVTSLEGFEHRVKRTGLTVKEPAGPNPKRHERVWATLRSGFEVDSRASDWQKNIKALYAFRNATAGGLLHPTTVFAPSEEHPSGAVEGTVSLAYSVFTVERADWAVAVIRDIYGACRGSVRPGHPDLEDLVNNVFRGTLKKLSVSNEAYSAWGTGGPNDVSGSD